MRSRAGLAAGPFFITIFLITGALTPGYNALRHPVSTLQLAPWGWIQTANFIITGLLIIAFATTIRFWGAWLIAAIGVGLIGSGIFLTDPTSGYPPGSPPLTDYTWHGALHDLFAVPTFLGWPLACFVFARRFGGIWSVITGLLFLTTFVATSQAFAQTPGLVEFGGLLQRITVTIGFVWLTTLAWTLANRRTLS